MWATSFCTLSLLYLIYSKLRFDRRFSNPSSREERDCVKPWMLKIYTWMWPVNAGHTSLVKQVVLPHQSSSRWGNVILPNLQECVLDIDQLGQWLPQIQLRIICFLFSLALRNDSSLLESWIHSIWSILSPLQKPNNGFCILRTSLWIDWAY